MKKTTRVLSLVLAMLMLFSVFSVAVSAKNVEVAETSATIPGGKVLYLKPNSNWVQGDAWFAAYFWASSNTWAKFEKCPNDSGYYKVTAPAGSWNNVIFCRMNPAKTALSWDSRWDQSKDLTWDGSNDLFTVDSGQWNNATGKWSAWSETPDATEPVETEPVETEPVETEPVETEPVETEPVETEPVETEPVVSKTAYCINSAKWSEVAAHAWVDGGAGTAWPGQVMTKTEDTVNGFDVYEVTFDTDYTKIIFNNNNNGSQTENLDFMEGQYYDVKSATWYASLDEVPQVDALASDIYAAGTFNGWSTVANEFKLVEAGSTTAVLTLTLEAETSYTYKIVNAGAWTSTTTAITGDVEGVAFSSSVSGDAKLTTTIAGDYVLTYDTAKNTLAVTYPVAPTDEETEPVETEPVETEPVETEPVETEPVETEPVETEPVETEPVETEPVETEPVVVIPAGYYLVGNLNGVDKWFVDADSADRMLVENPGAPGEYMLDYTFVEGDEIKVVYFDGTAIETWYNDGGGNYGIGAEKAGDATVYFRPDGNADWTYNYFTVIAKEIPTEPVETEPVETEPVETEPETEEPTKDPEATGDQPTVPTEPETEAPTIDPSIEFITIYFQNNWLWSDVCAYYWGSEYANSAEWPGDAMKFYDNDGLYDVYYVTVPADIKGIIFSGIKDDGSGDRDKTPNIEEGFYDGACYYMVWDNGNAVGSVDIDLVFPPETDAPTEPETDEPTQPEIEKVTKVEGVTVVDYTSRTFTVEWDAAEGIDAYWVYVDGVAYARTTRTTIVVDGRTNGSKYEVMVLGIFGDGTMTAKADADVVTAETLAYDFGTDFSTDAHSLTLYWDATEYTRAWVYIGTSADDLKVYDFSTVGEYTINGLDADTTYFYKIAYAVDGKIVGESDVVETATSADSQLEVTSTINEDGTVTLTWNEAYGSYKYWVTVESEAGTITYGADAATLTLTELSGEYTVTVKAACAVDGVFSGMLYYNALDLAV